jgi:N6-adenosine-specific RNA methylase IME4
MSFAELFALPVAQLAAPDCALFMWTTWPMLDAQGLPLLKAWGFQYKSGGAWAKRSRTGATWAFAGGYIERSACEPYLIGTRGNTKRLSRSIRNLKVAPVREHSRKPDCMHTDLENLYPGPRCELFARMARPGWDAWGNETEKFTPQPSMLET